jgi:hypothetical protein
MVWTSLTKISIIKMAVFRHWSTFYTYLRYKSKKLSFIARTGLKYDLGTMPAKKFWPSLSINSKKKL